MATNRTSQERSSRFTYYYGCGRFIDNMQKNKPDGGKKSKADGQRNGMAVVPKSGENMQQTSKWVRCFIC